MLIPLHKFVLVEFSSLVHCLTSEMDSKDPLDEALQQDAFRSTPDGLLASGFNQTNGATLGLFPATGALWT